MSPPCYIPKALAHRLPPAPLSHIYSLIKPNLGIAMDCSKRLCPHPSLVGVEGFPPAPLFPDLELSSSPRLQTFCKVQPWSSASLPSPPTPTPLPPVVWMGTGHSPMPSSLLCQKPPGATKVRKLPQSPAWPQFSPGSPCAGKEAGGRIRVLPSHEPLSSLNPHVLSLALGKASSVSLLTSLPLWSPAQGGGNKMKARGGERRRQLPSSCLRASGLRPL